MGVQAHFFKISPPASAMADLFCMGFWDFWGSIWENSSCFLASVVQLQFQGLTPHFIHFDHTHPLGPTSRYDRDPPEPRPIPRMYLQDILSPYPPLRDALEPRNVTWNSTWNTVFQKPYPVTGRLPIVV